MMEFPNARGVTSVGDVLNTKFVLACTRRPPSRKPGNVVKTCNCWRREQLVPPFATGNTAVTFAVKSIVELAILELVTALAAIVVAVVFVVVTSPVRFPTAPVCPNTLVTGAPGIQAAILVLVIVGDPVAVLQVATTSNASVAVVSTVHVELVNSGASPRRERGPGSLKNTVGYLRSAHPGCARGDIA